MLKTRPNIQWRGVRWLVHFLGCYWWLIIVVHRKCSSLWNSVSKRERENSLRCYVKNNCDCYYGFTRCTNRERVAKLCCNIHWRCKCCWCLMPDQLLLLWFALKLTLVWWPPEVLKIGKWKWVHKNNLFFVFLCRTIKTQMPVPSCSYPPIESARQQR